MNNNKCVDVIVIGGGPAGSSAAIMLAKAGIKTTLLEQHYFPRFHIGESLLPNCNNLLKKLGVWEKVQNQNFVIKRGGQFMTPNRSHLVTNIFSDGLIKEMDMTYQVERAVFDKILLDHAQENGVDIHQGTRVIELLKTPDGWKITAETDSQPVTFFCNWIVDASGRKCVMGRHLKLKREALPIPGRLAVYNHFKNIPRESNERGGDTLVIRLQDAWIWVIPLTQNITSVGVVLQSGDPQLRKQNLETLFWKKLQESEFLVALTRNAEATEDYKTDSDYSYAYENYATQNTFLVGDAASFIDPVFSSGVCLALESGIMAAETVASSIRCPERKVALFRLYTRQIKRKMSTMRKLVDMFYDSKGADILLSPRPFFKIPQAVNSILAGVLNPGWKVKWRLWLFYKIYARHQKRPLVQPIEWEKVTHQHNN